MTPQQKLERLIELAKESKEILLSIEDDYSELLPFSLHVDCRKAQIHIYNTKVFENKFPDYKITSHDHIKSEELSTVVDGVTLFSLREIKETVS